MDLLVIHGVYLTDFLLDDFGVDENTFFIVFSNRLNANLTLENSMYLKLMAAFVAGEYISK